MPHFPCEENGVFNLHGGVVRIKLIHVKSFISAPKLLLPFIRDGLQETTFNIVREKGGQEQGAVH